MAPAVERVSLPMKLEPLKLGKKLYGWQRWGKNRSPRIAITVTKLMM